MSCFESFIHLQAQYRFSWFEIVQELKTHLNSLFASFSNDLKIEIYDNNVWNTAIKWKHLNSIKKNETERKNGSKSYNQTESKSQSNKQTRKNEFGSHITISITK